MRRPKTSLGRCLLAVQLAVVSPNRAPTSTEVKGDALFRMRRRTADNLKGIAVIIGGILLLIPILNLFGVIGPKENWMDEPPADLLGRWVETSDEVTAGRKMPDAITVEKAKVTMLFYPPDTGLPQTVVLPMVKVEGQGDRIRVFCGESGKGKGFVASKMLLFQPEENGDFPRITSYNPSGGGGDFLGRYCRRVRN